MNIKIDAFRNVYDKCLAKIGNDSIASNLMILKEMNDFLNLMFNLEYNNEVEKNNLIMDLKKLEENNEFKILNKRGFTEIEDKKIEFKNETPLTNANLTSKNFINKFNKINTQPSIEKKP